MKSQIALDPSANKKQETIAMKMAARNFFFTKMHGVLYSNSNRIFKGS